MANYNKLMFLFILFLCVTNKANNKPVLSSIPIYDKSGNAIYRTVWHLESVKSYTLDQLFGWGSITFDQIGPCNLHKEVAQLQQDVGLPLDKPIFIITRNEGAGAYLIPDSCCDIIGLPYKDMYNCTDTIMRRGTIGHELGHLVWNQSKKTCLESIHTNRMYRIWWWFTGISYMASIMSLPITLHELSPKRGAIALSACLAYAFSRWSIAHYASQLHTEEMFCDKFAVESLGKTDQEKIALAQGRIRNFVPYQNKFQFSLFNVLYRMNDWFNDLIIPSTHPSCTERITQMNTCIDTCIHENKAATS